MLARAVTGFFYAAAKHSAPPQTHCSRRGKDVLARPEIGTFFPCRFSMIAALQSVGLILTVLAMVPALAHALEWPGKLRLSKESYLSTQLIYYPGFTFLGISEPLAILATLALLVMTPPGTPDFWLTLAALLGLIGMHAVYWLVTHPVNKFWLQGQKLSSAGSAFFSPESAGKNSVEWTDLRDRWEHSHAARAVLAFAAFVALVIAIATDSGA
jgi:hypothetical protein